MICGAYVYAFETLHVDPDQDQKLRNALSLRCAPLCVDIAARMQEVPLEDRVWLFDLLVALIP